MNELIFQGPFLTRNQAARRAGIPRELMPDRPDLLRIGGEFLEEVYFEFQFDESGVRADIGEVVNYLKRHYADDVIADWLVRPNPRLAGASPLVALDGRGTVERVVAAAEAEGPRTEEEVVTAEPEKGPPTKVVTPRRRGRAALRRRTAFPHPA